jgi:hypothetical protein
MIRHMTTYLYTIIAPPGSIDSMSVESINDRGRDRAGAQLRAHLA